jgi:hypothetical protein
MHRWIGTGLTFNNSAGPWGGAISLKRHRMRQFAQIEEYDATAQLDSTAHILVSLLPEPPLFGQATSPYLPNLQKASLFCR